MTVQVYDLRKIPIGACGRCGAKIQPQYLWCDNCEDLVVRESATSPYWIERMAGERPTEGK